MKKNIKNKGQARLKHFKKSRGLTWPQVAEALDTPLRTVEDWAGGRSRIPPATVKLLKIFLTTSPNERTQLYIRRLISGEIVLELRIISPDWKGQALILSHKLGKLSQLEYREMEGEVEKMSKIIGSKFGIVEEGQS